METTKPDDEKYDTEIADKLHGKVRGVDEEYIICAANWIQNEIVYSHQPNNILSGLVVCGRRHHNCYMTVSAMRPEFSNCNVEEGFLTSKNRWIDRREAAALAFDIGQIMEPKTILFSEDIY